MIADNNRTVSKALLSGWRARSETGRIAWWNTSILASNTSCAKLYLERLQQWNWWSISMLTLNIAFPFFSKVDLCEVLWLYLRNYDLRITFSQKYTWLMWKKHTISETYILLYRQQRSFRQGTTFPVPKIFGQWHFGWDNPGRLHSYISHTRPS